jgi:hypothetical protein
MMKDAVLAVITILKAYAPITTLTQTRIYRGDGIPANPTKPFIAVDFVTRTPEPPTSSSTYRTDRVQCTSFETTGVNAATLSDLIGDALAQDSNLISPPIPGFVISEIQDRGAVPDNSDAKTTGEFRDHHDIMITYRLR